MTTLEPTATPDPRAGLLRTIQARRASIEAYVRETAPVSRRLSTVSIVSSAVVAALTAGPALGGTDFAERVQQGLALEASPTVWQVLCLGALVVSVTAAVSANLEKTSDLRSRIGAAQAAGAMLTGLQARLEYGRLAVEEATEEYRDVLAGISFVPDVQADTAPGRARAGARSATFGEPRLAWHLAVVALAALLLGATAVGFVRGMVTAEQPGVAGGAEAPTAPGAPPPAPTAPAPTPSPTAETTQGVFAGRAEAGGAVLSIVIGADEAIAYVCDGRQLEAWLRGSLADGRLDLTGQSGASLTGQVADGAIYGHLRTAALDTPFTATAASPPAGVYEARFEVDGSDGRVGWAVLPDGEQVGVLTVDGTRTAAPRLDLTDRTFVHRGTEHRAVRLDP